MVRSLVLPASKSLLFIKVIRKGKFLDLVAENYKKFFGGCLSNFETIEIINFHNAKTKAPGHLVDFRNFC